MLLLLLLRKSPTVVLGQVVEDPSFGDRDLHEKVALLFIRK